MSLEALLARIPYVVWHDIRVVEESPGLVRLSLCGREEIANYVGTLHAGALYTLAETAAGSAANNVIDGNKAIVLLREATSRYTRRAEGDVVVSAAVDSGAAENALREFAEHARADVAVEAVVTDSDNETVFTGCFDYALRPRKL